MKGNICYSKSSNEICIVENGYLVCEDKKCAGVYTELPEQYEFFPLFDYSEQLVVPGLVDLHVHAPQYSFRGMAMNLELIDWLNVNNPGRNPSPVRRMEITNPFCWKSRFR